SPRRRYHEPTQKGNQQRRRGYIISARTVGDKRSESMTSIFRDRLFDDKVIVVSGGGTGIGRAIARELATLGATVVICSRSVEHLEPTRAEIASAGGNVTALACNIRDPEAVSAFF